MAEEATVNVKIADLPQVVDALNAANTEIERLRDLCRRAAYSAAGYRLIGGVFAELRKEGDRARTP